MEKITFKQFNAFVEAPIDGEQLDEIFGMFSSAEEKQKAEMEKLQILAKRGNEAAKMKLRNMQRDSEKAAAGKKAFGKMQDTKLANAKAHAEVADKGSSDAYRKETGSVRKNAQMYWDKEQNKWVRQDNWSHVGKHD